MRVIDGGRGRPSRRRHRSCNAMVEIGLAMANLRDGGLQILFMADPSLSNRTHAGGKPLGKVGDAALEAAQGRVDPRRRGRDYSGGNFGQPGLDSLDRL